MVRLQSLDGEIASLEQVDRFETHDARARDTLTRRLAILRRKRDRDRAILEQPSFHRSLEYTGLDVALEGVLRLGRIVALGLGFASVVVLAAAAAASLPAQTLLGIALFALVSPITAYVLVLSYPEGLARRIQVASLGGAPEAVNYMAMSMQVVPALDRAVEFAAAHVDDPLATRLRRVLWSVYLRKPARFEAAFLRFAEEWGDWQDDVKRALFALGSATLERTEAGLSRTLEKAREIAFEGTKTRIREYAASLRGPTTALFALGVLLPVIIGAILPLLSLGGLAPAVVGGGRSPGGTDLAVPIVLAMDVLFPAGAFVYAYRILGSRPGTGSHQSAVRPVRRRYLLVSSGLASAAVVLFVLEAGPVASILALWMLVSSGTIWLAPGLRDIDRKRHADAKLEAEFPDALFILGTRIAEGAPAEKALELTAEATRGSEVSSLFDRILRALQTSREGLESALFSKNGALQEVPSRTIHASFRMVIEASKKDSASAGKTVVEMSSYLRDIREADQEIRRDLGSVVEAMQSTGAFFAPLVLGVTCAMYGLLSRAFSGIVDLGLSPDAFLGVVGVYLILAVAVITYFRVGISHGRDPREVRSQLVRTWPVSMTVFTAAFIVSGIAFGA